MEIPGLAAGGGIFAVAVAVDPEARAGIVLDHEVIAHAAERALRGVAQGRKSWLFAGSDKGGERAGAIYSLIETAKLNGVDPEAWLRDTIARIADHPARRIDEFLPWNYTAA